MPPFPRHMDWVDRAGLLAGHLAAVVELDESRRYPSALAMTRVATRTPAPFLREDTPRVPSVPHLMHAPTPTRVGASARVRARPELRADAGAFRARIAR